MDPGQLGYIHNCILTTHSILSLSNLFFDFFCFAASGLQLFIAKDGTAALGSHEVKSQMSTGVQVFKQVVMDDNR